MLFIDSDVATLAVPEMSNELGLSNTAGVRRERIRLWKNEEIGAPGFSRPELKSECPSSSRGMVRTATDNVSEPEAGQQAKRTNEVGVGERYTFLRVNGQPCATLCVAHRTLKKG